MAEKPVVDGLEQQIRNEVRFARADLFTPVGQVLAARYHFNYTPFYVLFGADGQIIWTGRGIPPTREFVEERIK